MIRVEDENGSVRKKRREDGMLRVWVKRMKGKVWVKRWVRGEQGIDEKKSKKVRKNE